MSALSRHAVVCGVVFGLLLCVAYASDLKSAEQAFEQRDYQKALRQFRPLAKKNDPVAQRYLGEMYRAGTGVARNPDIAIEWFKRSANGGDPLAQVALGSIFLDRKMYQESAAYFAQAAQRGYSGAQLQLGYSYALGQGVQASATEAAKWFRAACERGDKTVSLLAGTELRTGKVVPKDANAAAVCLEKASSMGDLEASATLGIMYLNGEGVAPDPGQAQKLLQTAATGNSALALYGFGLMYERGSGVRQDYNEAAGWFLKAARKGSAEAQLALGRLYELGLGRPLDYTEALASYNDAARQGNTEAQFVLGQRYVEGRIASKDYVRAYVMLNLAAASGHAEARTLRENIAAMMTAEQIGAAQRLSRDWPGEAREQRSNEVLPPLRAPAQSINSKENCTGQAKQFWADGRQALVRFCAGLAVTVMPQPFDRDPLTYVVAVKNVSEHPIEIDASFFRLIGNPPLDPARLSARLRRRAGWAAGFAGFSESFGHNSRSTVYGTDGSIASVETHTSPSSAEVHAAQNRAAGPLHRRADSVEAYSLKRNTVFPGSVAVGVLYFQRIKKLSEGSLSFAVPGGPVLDFPVRLDGKR